MALILTRFEGEAVVVDFGGARLTIRVAELRRGKVKLMFAAPPEVKIDREEIIEQRDGKAIK